jgi:hypothetical protein
VNACRKLDPWWQSQGTSGGPQVNAPGENAGRGLEGPTGGRRPGCEEHGPFDEACGKHILAVFGTGGKPLGKKVVTGGVCGRLTGLVISGKSGHEPTLGKPGAPRGRVNAAAAGARSVNCVVTRGRRCRQRLSGVVVDGLEGTVVFTHQRESQAGRGGQRGESRQLGSWGPSGYS